MFITSVHSRPMISEAVFHGFSGKDPWERSCLRSELTGNCWGLWSGNSLIVLDCWLCQVPDSCRRRKKSSHRIPGETCSVRSCQAQKLWIRSSREVVRFLAIGFRLADPTGIPIKYNRILSRSIGFYRILMISGPECDHRIECPGTLHWISASKFLAFSDVFLRDPAQTSRPKSRAGTQVHVLVLFVLSKYKVFVLVLMQRYLYLYLYESTCTCACTCTCKEILVLVNS